MERNYSVILASSDPSKYEPDLIPESPKTLSPILQAEAYHYGTPENSTRNNEESPVLFPFTPTRLDSPDLYPATPKDQIPLNCAHRMDSMSQIVFEKPSEKTPQSILRIGSPGIETRPSATKSVTFGSPTTPICSPACEERPYISKLNTAFCLDKSSEDQIFLHDFTEDDFLHYGIKELTLTQTKSSSPSRTPLRENVGRSPMPSSPALPSPDYLEASLKMSPSMPQLSVCSGGKNEQVNLQKSTPKPQVGISPLAMSPDPASSPKSPSTDNRPKRSKPLIPFSPSMRKKIENLLGMSITEFRKKNSLEPYTPTTSRTSPKPQAKK